MARLCDLLVLIDVRHLIIYLINLPHCFAVSINHALGDNSMCTYTSSNRWNIVIACDLWSENFELFSVTDRRMTH